MTPDIAKKVSTNIKKYRQERKLTQGELAKLIDMSQPNIHEYESGKKSPGLDVLQKIAKALKIDISKLVS